MEYTDKERRILSLMERADFKNLSKMILLVMLQNLMNCVQRLQRRF